MFIRCFYPIVSWVYRITPNKLSTSIRKFLDYLPMFEGFPTFTPKREDVLASHLFLSKSVWYLKVSIKTDRQGIISTMNLYELMAIFMFSDPNHQLWTHQRQGPGFLFLPWCSPWRLGTLTCASLKVHHRRWWSVAQSRSTLSLGSRW